MSHVVSFFLISFLSSHIVSPSLTVSWCPCVSGPAGHSELVSSESPDEVLVLLTVRSQIRAVIRGQGGCLMSSRSIELISLSVFDQDGLIMRSAVQRTELLTEEPWNPSWYTKFIQTAGHMSSCRDAGTLLRQTDQQDLTAAGGQRSDQVGTQTRSTYCRHYSMSSAGWLDSVLKRTNVVWIVSLGLTDDSVWDVKAEVVLSDWL